MTPSATLTFRGRLPGVGCEPALPGRTPPVRLDVAGFVGFAERGPVNVPVPVEDAIQYATVFGGDLALAQDGGAPVHAQLPSAVRAFFDNGGRRCHVVRVAGPGASAGRWRVPGLQVWQPDGSVTDAEVESAWPGAWSAGTSVQTNLLSQHLPVGGPYAKRRDGADGVLTLGRGATVGLQPGDLLRLRLGTRRLYVRIASVDARTSQVTTSWEMTYQPGTPDLPKPARLAQLPTSTAVHSVQLLRFDLVVRQHTARDSRVLERIREVTFGGPPEPRRTERPFWAATIQQAGAEQPDLTRSMTLRVAPGTDDALVAGVAVPVGMDQPGTMVDPAVDEVPPALQDGTDDLGTFDARWFVDGNLAGDTVASVVSHVDQLTVLAEHPRRLSGLHALAAVDEVALVAVPDALHRGWQPVAQPQPDEPVPPAEPGPLDWSDFRCCSDTPPEPPAPEPVPAPTEVDLLPQLDRVADYDEPGLLRVQTALVTLCAAQADRVALLSVPAHYDVAATLAWQARLTGEARIADGNNTGFSPLSYAGFWHPWVSIVSGRSGGRSVLRDIAPDGPVAGMIAARELRRGCWIAPAGVPLRGPVRLATPQPLSDEDEALLFNAHANLVVRAPGTFSLLSAHTLSSDAALLQVNVRRLLILLRKICLRLGQRYTFEVNNDRFRQLVRMRFDRILSALVERGALHAFRVVIDGSVNTPEDQEAGRFVVVLQVAPTSPVEFITITLLRSGEGLLDVLEG